VVDTYEAFVWEPALVKSNAITAATEAACLVRMRPARSSSSARLLLTLLVPGRALAHAAAHARAAPMRCPKLLCLQAKPRRPFRPLAPYAGRARRCWRTSRRALLSPGLPVTGCSQPAARRSHD